MLALLRLLVVSCVLLHAQLAVCALPPECTESSPCDVIIDQDCGAVADTNSRAVMLALNDPALNVLGVTSTYGDNWASASFAHCLRAVEILGARVPVFWGARKPFSRTWNETRLFRDTHGFPSWLGQYNPNENATFGINNGPGVLDGASVHSRGAMREGFGAELIQQTGCTGNVSVSCAVPVQPNAAALFIVEMIHKRPGLSILAMGPLNNVALARMLDESIVAKAHLWMMGGSFRPLGSDVEHIDTPRHETNWFFCPQATRRALRPWRGLNWRSISTVPIDTAFGVLLAPVWTQLERSSAVAARYIVECSPLDDVAGLVDEVAVGLFTQRSLATYSSFYVDVDVSTTGSNSGSTLSWHNSVPAGTPGLVNVFVDLDKSAFYSYFVSVITRGSAKGHMHGNPICTSRWDK